MSRWVLMWVWLLALPAQSAPARRVELMVHAPEAHRALLVRSLGELLGRLDVILEVYGTLPDAGAPDISARVVLELLDDEAQLTLSDSDGQVVLFRRIPRMASPELLVEACAHVVHSAVGELLAAPPRRRVVASDPPLLSAPAPLATVVASPGPGLSLGAFLGSRAFGGGAPLVLQAGIGVEVRAPWGRWWPGAGLTVAYNSPLDASGSLVAVRTESVSMRLLPEVRLLGGQRWAIDFALGAGTDIFFSSPRSSELPPGRLTREHVDLAPVASAMLSGHFAAVRSADLFIGLSLDVDLEPRRFVADVAGNRELVYQPWRFRPSLVLGFSFTALGDGSSGVVR